MKIRRRENRAIDPKTRRPTVSWQLDAGIIGGRRYQRSFPTVKAAKAAWQELRAKVKREGSDAYALPAAERARMVEASQKMAGVGATIEQAVEFYMKHAVTVTERITVGDLVARGLAAKVDDVKRGVIRPEYVGTLRVV